ncbi:MAG: Uma2 family endonuclease [Pseudomonadota bacterium]
MSKPQLKLATYADLEAVPAPFVAEILDGELVTHPRPRIRHSIASSALTTELVGPYQMGRSGPGGWIFMTEPELHGAGNVVVPDLAGWRRERISEPLDAVGVETVPDWVCEILSPSTATYDRTVKFRIYHQFGVPQLWYVDPEARTLEVFGRSDHAWSSLNNYRGSDPVSAPPFDQITFDLGVLWPLDPTGPETTA